MEKENRLISRINEILSEENFGEGPKEEYLLIAKKDLERIEKYIQGTSSNKSYLKFFILGFIGPFITLLFFLLKDK